MGGRSRKTARCSSFGLGLLVAVWVGVVLGFVTVVEVKVGHHNHHFEINFVSAFFPFFCAPHQHTQRPSQCIANKDVELRMRCDPFYRANTHALLSIAFEPRPHHRFRRERREAVLQRAEKAGLVIVLVAFVPIVPSSRNVQKPG